MTFEPLSPIVFRTPGNATLVEGSEPTALRIRSIANAIGNSPSSPPSTWQLYFLREECLTNYFLTQYSVPCRPGVYSGHLEFLPDLLASSSPTSPLWPATCALANLVLSRRYKSPGLYERARKSYGCALWSLNDNLSQAPDTWQDDTVAAIMLLHQIEDIDGGSFINRAAHIRGIAELYKARGQKLLSKLPGCSLYSWAFSELQIHSFITQTSYECLTIPRPGPDTNHIPTATTMLIAKVGHFWSTLAERLSVLRLNEGTDQEQPRQLLLPLLFQAVEIQTETEAQIGCLPATWRFKEAVQNDGHFLVTYADQWLGNLWTLYNAVQIIFHHGLINCCRSLSSLQDRGTSRDATLVETSHMAATENLKRRTELVCASIPFLLGEVDIKGEIMAAPECKASNCYHLIWPLALVAQSRYSTREQVRLCERTLENIRSTYGIHLAESARDVAARLFHQ